MTEYKWYCVLVIVRLLLVMVPQSGYIHPDEFFQTTEIIAGKLTQKVLQWFKLNKCIYSISEIVPKNIFH